MKDYIDKEGILNKSVGFLENHIDLLKEKNLENYYTLIKEILDYHKHAVLKFGVEDYILYIDMNYKIMRDMALLIDTLKENQFKVH